MRQAGPDILEITWSDGRRDRYPVRGLRLACPCANCVDELTGKLLLDPARIPHDVRPRRITSVGNYAIQIAWSDGHDSGIYAFPLLRKLGKQP